MVYEYIKECEHCKREFKAYRINKRFCTESCAAKKRNLNKPKLDLPLRRCIVCNQKFKPKKHLHVICSHLCRRKYRDGHINLNLDYREYLFEKNNFTCLECGKRTNELHIHHIIPLYLNGKDELDNLMVLCENCHKTKHRGLK